MNVKTNIDDFLRKEEPILNFMHYVTQELNIPPNNDHISTCIKYQDGFALSDDFLKTLINTVIKFVFTTEDIEEKKNKLKEAGSFEEEVFTELFQEACSFFVSKKAPKGQFSELLLSTLLKTHFRAVPFVFKMKATTNTELEINGADAIHIAKHYLPDKYKVYLGEAKTYPSGFSNAFRNAQDSIFATLNNIFNERKIYIKNKSLFENGFHGLFEDWVNHTEDKFEINLVCIISFCVKDNISIELNSQKNYEKYMGIIKDNCSRIKDMTLNKYGSNPHFIRLHYIFFPVDDLDELITRFAKKLSR